MLYWELPQRLTHKYSTPTSVTFIAQLIDPKKQRYYYVKVQKNHHQKPNKKSSLFLWMKWYNPTRSRTTTGTSKVFLSHNFLIGSSPLLPSQPRECPTIQTRNSCLWGNLERRWPWTWIRSSCTDQSGLFFCDLIFRQNCDLMGVFHHSDSSCYFYVTTSAVKGSNRVVKKFL